MVRNPSGQPVGWICKRFLGITNPLILEALAHREASIRPSTKGSQQIFIEGDSLAVIQALKDSTPNCHLARILCDIMFLTSTLSSFDFLFINRERNGATYHLAKKCLQDGSFLYNPLIQFNHVLSSLPI